MPPTLLRGGWGKDMFVPPPLSDPEFRPRHRATDICDVTLAWLASRCWARQMCPPPTFCHVPTPLTNLYEWLVTVSYWLFMLLLFFSHYAWLSEAPSQVCQVSNESSL